MNKTKHARRATMSAHGLRHRMLEVLAGRGYSEYALMAIAGHSDPATTKRYTQNVERQKLAGQALRKFNPKD